MSRHPRSPAQPRCLLAGKGCPATPPAPLEARQLCAACYQAALRAVTAGETTWDLLVAAGLARPARGRSGPAREAFRRTGAT